MSSANDSSQPTSPSPANRLGLNYRDVPPRKVALPIIDAHAHIRGLTESELYFEVAAAYGIEKTISMTPVEQVDEMRERFPDRLEFIAVPRWRELAATAAFQKQWMADLETYREKDVRFCKFWMAPRMRQEYGLTLDHPLVKTVTRHAHDLGYHFMTHVADPSVWWNEKYADADVYGTKPEQYGQLERFLDEYPDRITIGAHMGGSVEELDFLQGLLDRHPNLVLDSSATKWIVREVARQPAAVRDFIIANQERVLFGSDIVVDKKHDFDHYASRYWAHLKMWETDYAGQSPIEDPDADDPPRLAGLNLPADVLTKMYRTNALRVLRASQENAAQEHTA